MKVIHIILCILHIIPLHAMQSPTRNFYGNATNIQGSYDASELKLNQSAYKDMSNELMFMHDDKDEFTDYKIKNTAEEMRHLINFNKLNDEKDTAEEMRCLRKKFNKLNGEKRKDYSITTAIGAVEETYYQANGDIIKYYRSNNNKLRNNNKINRFKCIIDHADGTYTAETWKEEIIHGRNNSWKKC